MLLVFRRKQFTGWGHTRWSGCGRNQELIWSDGRTSELPSAWVDLSWRGSQIVLPHSHAPESDNYITTYAVFYCFTPITTKTKLTNHFVYIRPPVGSAGLRLWRPWCTQKNEAPCEGGVWGGVFPLARDGGVTPGKILKFETQFGAIWCILARNWQFSSFPPLWTKTLP